MDRKWIQQASEYRNKQFRRRQWRQVVTALACVVVFCTTYALILPAITMERAPTCGMQEHTHGTDCYGENGELICTLPAHTHSAACYPEQTPAATEATTTETTAAAEATTTETTAAAETTTTETTEATGTTETTTSTEETGTTETTEATETTGQTDPTEATDPTEQTDSPEQLPALNLRDYITAVEARRQVDGQWAQAEKIFAGETVQVTLRYSVPAEALGECAVLTLPAGAAPKEDAAVLVLDGSGNQTGFCECEGRELTISYDEPAPEDGLTGKLVYETVLLPEGTEETKQVTFADGVSLSVEPAPQDTESAGSTGTEESGNVSDGPLLSLAPNSLMQAVPAVLSAVPRSEAISFEKFINQVTIEKSVNGQYQDITNDTVQDGDAVRVKLDYQVPPNTLNTDNRVIHYTPPVGMLPIGGSNGPVNNSNGQTVGTYTVSNDGKITITFDEAFVAGGQSFDGDFYYQGQASLGESKDETKIEFPGTTAFLTVKPRPESSDGKGHSVQKQGSSLKEDGTVDYTVTISTDKKNGSGELDFTDVLTNANFKEDSVTVTKFDTNGQSQPVTNVTASAQPNNEGKQVLTLNGLKPLSQGEYYEVKYTVKPNTDKENADGSLKIGNSVKVGGQEKWTPEVEISKSRVGKTGSWDSRKETISWTINVNENGDDISGWTLTDTLQEDISYAGPIKVTDSQGNTVATIEKPADGSSEFTYTFPENSKDKYTVTYETTAPAEDGQVTNKAELKDPEKDKPYTTGPVPVYVSYRTEKLEKNAFGTPQDGADNVTFQWSTGITLTSEKFFKKYGEVVYTDTIIVPNGGAHYGLQSEIQSAIAESLSFTYVEGGSTNTVKGSACNTYFTWNLECRDDSGNPVTDDNAQVASFVLTVTPKDNLSDALKGEYIGFTYPTHGQLPGLSEGESATITNKGTWGDMSVEANQSYKKPKRLEKLLLADGEKSGSVEQELEKLEKDESGYPLLTWRVKVYPTKEENGAITLTDTLPEGTEFVGLTSWKLYWSEDENTAPNPTVTGSDGNIAYDFTYPNGVNKPEYESSEDGRTVTITIPGGYNTKFWGHPLTVSRHIVLEYTVRLTDAVWTNAEQTQIVLTNTVVGMGSSSSQSTTITRQPEVVKKTAVQIKGTGDNRVRYTVFINPGAKDLIPEKDFIVLKDQMDTDPNLMYTAEGSNKITATLLWDTLALYDYDPNAQNKCGAQLEKSLYRVQVDTNAPADKPGFSISLPDSRAMVLVYEYRLDMTKFEENKEYPVSNTVSLAGQFANTNKFQVHNYFSAANANKDSLSIYKRDKDNPKVLLNGAKFDLEMFNGTGWVSAAKDLVTGKFYYGMLYFEQAHDGDTTQQGGTTLKRDTLYRLTETEAPPGYRKAIDPCYFCWLNKKSKEEITLPAGVSRDNVQFPDTSKAEASFYVDNKPGGITVRKQWLNANGSAAAAPVDSVEVELRYSTQKFLGSVVTVQTHVEWGNPTHLQTFMVKKGSKISFTLDDWNQNVTLWIDGVETVFPSVNNVVSAVIPIINDSTTIEMYDWQKQYILPNIRTTASDDYDYEYNWLPVENVGNATLTAQNGWTFSWDDLPKVDKNGETLYYMVVEVGAPVGWKPMYGSTNGSITSGLIDVLNVENSTTPQPLNVTVEKVWMNANGGSLDDPDIQNYKVNVQLYQVTQDANGSWPETGTAIGDPVTLKPGQWTHTWPNLLRADDNGNSFGYRVVEVQALDGDEEMNAFQVTYSVDGGEATEVSPVLTDTGTVTVTNTRQSSYELPETGGGGTIAYQMAGLALLALGMFGLTLQKRKPEKGAREP